MVRYRNFARLLGYDVIIFQQYPDSGRLLQQGGPPSMHRPRNICRRLLILVQVGLLLVSRKLDLMSARKKPIGSVGHRLLYYIV